MNDLNKRTEEAVETNILKGALPLWKEYLYGFLNQVA